ncbi:reverse transcriptase/maturase family protein [Halalkalibacillus sediminis]|nr:reverse transcriptase/maturase family protein [Halalkalibacillus sediminis]
MVLTRELLEEYFKIDNIIDYYHENKRGKNSVGIDKVNSRLFNENLNWYAKTINRKIMNGSYKFTPYKQKLISKGKSNTPRQISIPTIKDKITLGLLKEILHKKFLTDIYYETVHTIISDLESEIQDPHKDYFFKIDISDFYGNIDHEKLFKKLRKRIRDKKLLKILKRSIKTPTVKEGSQKDKTVNTRGVPQGLPVSNILSSIYMNALDDKYINRSDLIYKRFVDDIIIICNNKDSDAIYNEIVRDLTSKTTLDLIINPEKKDEGFVSNGFYYLGYFLDGTSTTIRKEAITNMKKSLESIFVTIAHTYKKSNPNINFFLWQLNLRITGSKYGGRKYGWLIFYSQISEDNEDIFHHLDWFVRKKLLQDRFKLQNLVDKNQIKRFTRAYNEIRKNFTNTRYLPNFDNYSHENKVDFIEGVLGKPTVDLSKERVDYIFNNTIYKEVNQLEKDIQGVSF